METPSRLSDRVRAVVVKLYDADPAYTERAWVACSMSESTYELLDDAEWIRWRTKALDSVLADWRSYEIREVVIRIPQEPLEALFAADPIIAEVES